MIKSVSRNWEIYKNLNNVGVIYEYFGNNAFTEADVFELGDFIQQNKVFSELLILNVKWTKKYYISFFYGEPGYANNINNYDPVAFNNRYNDILSLKLKIEKLKMFEGKIIDTNLKLYSFDENADNLSYLEKSINSNWLKFDEKSFNLALLKKYFPWYVDNSIWSMDYKDYILQTFYQKDTNFDFFNIDQAIFEPVLNFIAGNEFFLFPFYYSGITQKTWVMEYQMLDLTADIMFLDSGVGKDYDTYLKKISFSPKWNGIATDKNENYVVVDWNKSHFPVRDINDDQNMFFEINHSLFIYTKKPDVSGFLVDFNQKFWTQIIPKPKKVSKEFNEMYLSHNTFEQICHLGHIKNLSWIMKLTKEYMKPNKRGAVIWYEYFSNNELSVNLFDIVGIDPSDGSLADKANWFFIWDSWSGKTFFSKKFMRDNKTDQIIVFDNMSNFEQMVNDSNKDIYNVMKYGPEFPNLIWRIKSSNISEKQGLLYKIVIWANTEISWELKESIRGICNMFMEKSLWTMFNLDTFVSYVKSVDDTFLSTEDKRVFINKLLWLNVNMKAILNNKLDLFDEFLLKQKIILSYKDLAKESVDSKNFVLSILLDSVVNYLADKRALSDTEKAYKYTIVMVDEAHNMINEDRTLESSLNAAIRQVRNYFASLILISQQFWDFMMKTQPDPKTIYEQTSFHVILSPNQWNSYVNYYGDGWKKSLIFSNLRPQIEKIEEKYNEDAKLEAENKLTGQRTRFCIFGYKTGNAYYIVNTNKKR